MSKTTCFKAAILSYRTTLLLAVVSQSSFVLVLRGHRATIARHVAEWGITRTCLQNWKYQEGIVTPLGGRCCDHWEDIKHTLPAPQILPNSFLNSFSGNSVPENLVIRWILIPRELFWLSDYRIFLYFFQWERWKSLFLFGNSTELTSPSNFPGDKSLHTALFVFFWVIFGNKIQESLQQEGMNFCDVRIGAVLRGKHDEQFGYCYHFCLGALWELNTVTRSRLFRIFIVFGI